jgi:hypothetical protein
MSGQIRSIAIIPFLAAATLLVSCIGEPEPPTPLDPNGWVREYWDTTHVRDYAYHDGRIFDLAYPGEIGPNDTVVVWVFTEEWRPDNPEALLCDLDAGDIVDPNDDFDIRDILMKPVHEGWELLYGQDAGKCPIAVVFHEGQRNAVGIVMEIRRHDESETWTGVDSVGNLAFGVLRMVRPPNSDFSPDHPAWGLTWRNCYRIPSHIAFEDIAVTVHKGLPGSEWDHNSLDYQVLYGQSQDPYLAILGLDRYNNTIEDLKVPDGRLDNRAEVFRSDWGLLIFTEREPFNSRRTFQHSNGEVSDSLMELVPSLYHYRSSSERIANSSYFLRLQVRRIELAD